MSRQHMYRARHKSGKYPVAQVASIVFDNPQGPMLIYTNDHAEPWTEEECELLRYTGIKDENNVEGYHAEQTIEALITQARIDQTEKLAAGVHAVTKSGQTTEVEQYLAGELCALGEDLARNQGLDEASEDGRMMNQEQTG